MQNNHKWHMIYWLYLIIQQVLSTVRDFYIKYWKAAQEFFTAEVGLAFLPPTTKQINIQLSL